MATGICYTQSGTEKRYEYSGPSPCPWCILVKSPINDKLDEQYDDVISYIIKNKSTDNEYCEYSINTNSLHYPKYTYFSKGNKDDSMPLIFVTYYPSYGKNPCYFNFNKTFHTVRIHIRYAWVHEIEDYDPFDLYDGSSIHNYQSYSIIVDNKIVTLKNINDLTFKCQYTVTIDESRSGLNNFKIYAEKVYTPELKYNSAGCSKGSTFILEYAIEGITSKTYNINDDTDIYLTIANKYICLSPLFNVFNKNEYPGSFTNYDGKHLIQTTISDKLYQWRSVSYRSDYINSFAAVAIYKWKSALALICAPLIPSFGYDSEYSIGGVYGWLKSIKYNTNDNLYISQAGGMYWLATDNTLYTLSKEDNRDMDIPENFGWNNANNSTKPYKCPEEWPDKIVKPYVKSEDFEYANSSGWFNTKKFPMMVGILRGYQVVNSMYHHKKYSIRYSESTISSYERIGTLCNWGSIGDEPNVPGIHISGTDLLDGMEINSNYKNTGIPDNLPRCGVFLGCTSWEGAANSGWNSGTPMFKDLPAEYYINTNFEQCIYVKGKNHPGAKIAKVLYAPNNDNIKPIDGAVVSGHIKTIFPGGTEMVTFNRLLIRLQKYAYHILNKWVINDVF